MNNTCRLLMLCLPFLVLTTTGTDLSPHPNLTATLWVQQSAEWRALCLQTWNTAAHQLSPLLHELEESAALEQAGDRKLKVKPPAIIVDVDETVLDNSPYQARLIMDQARYSDETWARWVKQEAAAPVPGSLRFLTAAARQGVTVFYVTNRLADLEDATRANLSRCGFPLAEDVDVVLMKGEKEGWTSDKSTRRKEIARTHRIIMLIGDDLGDFTPAARGHQSQRLAAAQAHTIRWGRQWFILPNPTYGSWQKTLPRPSGNEEIPCAAWLRGLDPRRP